VKVGVCRVLILGRHCWVQWSRHVKRSNDRVSSASLLPIFISTILFHSSMLMVSGPPFSAPVVSRE
jgi:hypothetical protein